MGKKRKNGHKMNPVRKYGKMALKILGIGLGTAVALTPAMRAWNRASGTGTDKFTSFSAEAGYEYLGLKNDGGWESGKVVAGVGAVAGGIGLMWLFGQLAKRI